MKKIKINLTLYYTVVYITGELNIHLTQTTMKTESEILEQIQDVKNRMAERRERISNGETDMDDCFVSDRLNSLEIQRLETELEVVRNGGVSDFPAIFDLETGELVSSKIVNGRYGACFVIEDDAKANKFGRFVSATLARDSSYTNKGLKIGSVELPARVTTRANGSGMAGAYCSTVTIIPARN